MARWAGTFGFALPAITLVVYPIWSFPETQTSGTELALWAATHHDRLVVTMLLNTAGVTLWLIFGAAVWTYLRDRLSARSTLPACFAAGLIGCVILLLSGFTAFDLLLYRHHGAETSMLLYDLTFGLLAMSGMPTVVALGRSRLRCTSTGCCHGIPLTSRSPPPQYTPCSSQRSSSMTGRSPSRVSRSRECRRCCSPGFSEPHSRCRASLTDQDRQLAGAADEIDWLTV